MMRKHILVVDDDAALRSVLTMRLEYNGHTVEAAETGLDALNRLAYADSVNADYDVVLLDYMMPGITGLMVLNHMQLRYPDVSVVMMTGHAGGQIADLALAAGARVCLTKPFDSVELEHALRCCDGIAA
jgi:CheY-like chemotaxis protein